MWKVHCILCAEGAELKLLTPTDWVMRSGRLARDLFQLLYQICDKCSTARFISERLLVKGSKEVYFSNVGHFKVGVYEDWLTFGANHKWLLVELQFWTLPNLLHLLFLGPAILAWLALDCRLTKELTWQHTLFVNVLLVPGCLPANHQWLLLLTLVRIWVTFQSNKCFHEHDSKIETPYCSQSVIVFHFHIATISAHYGRTSLKFRRLEVFLTKLESTGIFLEIPTNPHFISRQNSGVPMNTSHFHSKRLQLWLTCPCSLVYIRCENNWHLHSCTCSEAGGKAQHQRFHFTPEPDLLLFTPDVEAHTHGYPSEIARKINAE